MPQDLRVVPWEQFLSYHEEILDKVDRVPETTSNDESKVLSVDSQGDLEGADLPEGLPAHDCGMGGRVLTLNENNGGPTWIEPQSIPEYDIENANQVLMVNESGGRIEWADVPETTLPDAPNQGSILIAHDNHGNFGWTDYNFPENTGSLGQILALKNGEYDLDGVDAPQGLPSYTENDIDKSLSIVTNNTGETKLMGASSVIPDYDRASSRDRDRGKVLIASASGLFGNYIGTYGPTTATIDNGSTLQGINGHPEGVTAMNAPQIPPYDESEDGGKILMVTGDTGGEVAWVEPSRMEILPEYDQDDYGKVLSVVNGNLDGVENLPVYGNEQLGQFLKVGRGGSLEGADSVTGGDSLPTRSTDSDEDYGKLLMIGYSGELRGTQGGYEEPKVGQILTGGSQGPFGAGLGEEQNPNAGDILVWSSDGPEGTESY